MRTGPHDMVQDRHATVVPRVAPPSSTATPACRTTMPMRQTPLTQRLDVPRGVALNLIASALTLLSAMALLGTATVIGDGPQRGPSPRSRRRSFGRSTARSTKQFARETPWRSIAWWHPTCSSPRPLPNLLPIGWGLNSIWLTFTPTSLPCSSRSRTSSTTAPRRSCG